MEKEGITLGGIFNFNDLMEGKPETLTSLEFYSFKVPVKKVVTLSEYILNSEIPFFDKLNIQVKINGIPLIKYGSTYYNSLAKFKNVSMPLPSVLKTGDTISLHLLHDNLGKIERRFNSGEVEINYAPDPGPITYQVLNITETLTPLEFSFYMFGAIEDVY
ncbi:MAG TPA: hypothetical protein PKY81_15025 [bacterium]|nr:hypothetical protein [bacterium]